MGMILFLFILAALCFWLAPKVAGVSSKGTALAKANYEAALKRGDRVEALKWGREYFRSLRWHNGYLLTIYDEQRIQNDINVYCASK